MTLENIIQFGTFVISVFAFIIAWRKGSGEARKLKADALESLSDTALNLVHELEKKLELERQGYARKLEEKQIDFEASLTQRQADFENKLNTLGTELLNERQARRLLEERVTQLEKENQKLEIIKLGLENDRAALTSENGKLKIRLEELIRAREGDRL